MKKFLLSLFVIVLFLAYSFYVKKNATTATTPDNPNNILMFQNRGKFTDGTYTGKVTDAFYGNIQVQITVQNGNLTDIQFLQFPNDHPESLRISQESMPILTREAIKAQSAKVDIVSGATQTSDAFNQSLQSALDQAL